MNGKSALPPSRVKITVPSPSVAISVIGATSGPAAEVEFSPRWKLIELATSVAVTALPEWKVTPGRSLNRQTEASAEASQLSATSGMSEPSAATSVR